MTGLSTVLPFPLYTGVDQQLSPLVPSCYPIGLGGRPYLLDLEVTYFSSRFTHASIPILKPQQDTSGQVSESSLNPEGLWRRSQDDWHEGAGQTYLDKVASSSARFRSSQGVDIFTKGQFTLLNDTFEKLAISGGAIGDNIKCIVAGDFLYVTYDATVAMFTDVLAGGMTPDSTNTVSANIQSVATDGNSLYLGLGSSGLWTIPRGTTTATLYNPVSVDIVGYALGRLMVSSRSSIYNITSAVLPDPLYTHPNPDFTWVGFAEGNGNIYAGGYSGDKSIIYRTQVRPDGTALDIPSAAGRLPDGEIVRSIYGYLGFILIGTDNGVRFAVANSTGDLTIGELIKTNSPVLCFEGQDRFVWFGWTNYTTESTGLGRCDLTTLVDGSAPAYATDLMTTNQGLITSVVTFQGRRVFTVGLIGLFNETATKVPIATIDSGLISYNLPEEKIAVFVDVRYLSLNGTDQIWLSRGDGNFTLLGVNTAMSQTKQFPANNSRAEFHEIRHVLFPSADLLSAPVVTRHTLKAQPTTDLGEIITLPILMFSKTRDLTDNEVYMDPDENVAFLISLWADRSIITYQEGDKTYNVTVDDYEFRPTFTDPSRLPSLSYQGTMVMKLKKIV